MTMFKKHKRRISKGSEAGFTMVELILVIVLTSILGMFGFQMLTQSLLAQRNVQVRKEHCDDSVLAMNTIRRELMESTAVTTGSTLTCAIGGSSAVYSLNGSDLERTSGGTPNVIAKDVTSFATSVNGNGSILVNLTFAGETAGREIKVFRRN